MKQYIKVLSMVSICTALLMGCSNEENETNNHSGKEAVAQESSENETSNKTQISDEEQKKIKEEIIDWLAEDKKEDGKAVSNRYFSTSSISDGDWYAGTEKGEIQINNTGKPGPEAFDLHAVTGAVAYTPKDGESGFDKEAEDLSNVEGYKEVADLSKPVTKYIFTEEGKVYEYQFEGKDDVTLASGFAPKDHTGKDPNLRPDQQFKETENKALSKFYKELVEEYK
ncbi:hypothetical protein ABLV92_13745 [Staphylococcus equorum]|uniref:hypothetical protein n=1 Tax=Staphylococcus equorum TaxID=246432 RepID=UPI003A8174A7